MGLQFTIQCKMPGLTCCKYRIQTTLPFDNVMRAEVWCTDYRYDYENIVTGTICKCEEVRE